jgi:hypothetical protein
MISGELTKPSSTTESKHFNDKLRLSLASKSHLNTILKTMPYIPKNKIKTIKFPLIQIMGLSCHIHAISIIDEGVYLIEPVKLFAYHRRYTDLENGDIQKIIQSYSIIDDLITNIQDSHSDYSVIKSLSKKHKLFLPGRLKNWSY